MSLTQTCGWFRLDTARASRSSRARQSEREAAERRQHFQNNDSNQTGIAGAVDLTRPSGGQQALDYVSPKLLTRREAGACA